MAYTTAIATTKANVEALITALTGTETIDELLIISKAATGLNCSNYSVLETAIETLIDTQTPSTAHEDILLASRLINATHARTHAYFDTQVISSSSNVSVPANASRCFVSCTASGSSYNTEYYGAAYVVEFEIGVSPNGTLNVTVGSGSGTNHRIGDLTVYGGSAQIIGGTVTLAGVTQPVDGVTVFNHPDTVQGYQVPRSDITLKFEIVEVV